MSRFGRPYGDGVVIVAAFDAAGGRYDRHEHEEHQLAWASSGLLTVSTRTGVWVLPPARALWIPARTPHVTEAERHTTLHSVYFGAARGPAVDAPVPMAIGDLARQLMLHLARADLAPAARRRAENVLLDQLDAVPVTTIAVPMPRDARALDVARAVIADPSDDATLEVWGRRAGAGTRTLARLFVAETGMSFGRWRTHVRLRAALPLLADGMPVAGVARRVGYATPSAFVATFRKVMGVTPGAYFTSR
jgi:AraC-like DNA-binding protein